jgi:adenylate cyclase
MAADADSAAPELQEALFRRTYCGPPPRLTFAAPSRAAHYAESVRRRQRVLNITTWIAAAVTASFATLTAITEPRLWYITLINFVSALIYATIPFLHRFGDLLAPLTLIVTSYVNLTVICLNIGTGSGLQFYFLVAATVVVLVLGTEHIVLTSILVGIGAAIVIALQYLVPADTGLQPHWALITGFVVSIISASVMIVATVWYALHEIARAETVMEQEYERSESLLENILPSSIAERLKDPSTRIIADRYADASILFADIAGYTERASETTPVDLVQFLNQLYTDFDRLVERHGLEKIKTSGDCYIVVSGVPEPRADHLEALACLSLKMAEAVEGLIDPRGHPVPMRIGLGAGPVVAGVIGSRRFFYDVWGDAVNVASRMESTGVEGKIQIPEAVYERLKHDFVLEQRGEVAVKGKGVMRTWFLLAQKSLDELRGQPARSEVSLANRSSSADVT